MTGYQIECLECGDDVSRDHSPGEWAMRLHRQRGCPNAAFEVTIA